MSETEINTPKLGVGEIVICNKETNGKFEPLKYFIGKVILSIGGGGDKIYVVEDKDSVSSEVKSIQLRGTKDFLKSDTKFNQRENEFNLTEGQSKNLRTEDEQKQDDFLNHGSDTGGNNDKNENNEKEAQIIQICKGKYHLVKLTSDGSVSCLGKPYFGVTGWGGAGYSETTKAWPNLKNMKIIQIAAGEFHSLALADNGDLYTWGMGFEGQLGLALNHKVASSPRYLTYFYRKPVKFIACGHNYSLAITENCELYGWGENKLGQLGLGHIQIVEQPTLIPILDKNGGQKGCNNSESLVNAKYEREYTNKPLKCCYVAAGYAHTAVVTEEGFPVTFGLNIYGQLGLGDTTTSFEPRLIEKDEGGEKLECISKAACGTGGTFLISQSGKMYSCGSGNIGHGDLNLVKLPKMIAGQRLYSHVFCNDNSVVAFGPLRIWYVSPSCGAATGNTILSIIGSAFKDFRKLRVRFIFAGVSRDVQAKFDKLSRTIFVNTPNFIEWCPNMELPCYCVIQVTFDGNYFTEYGEKFLIYPNTIKISAIEPKCGPIEGGKSLQVNINLDQIPKKYLFSLTVGFQAKPPVWDSIRKTKSRKISITQTANVGSAEDSKITTENNKDNNNTNSGWNPAQPQKTEQAIINPMDMSNLDGQLDKANWYCCFSTYEAGVMTCVIPKIENFSQSQVEYNVDVAINGQQFSGYPMIYRFYDIKIDKIRPDISTIEGGLKMKIEGTGWFDSITKKARITSTLGERYTEVQWDRADKDLGFVSVPLSWITNDESIIKSENPEELYNKYKFDVSITMNNEQWIPAGSFRYCHQKINRIAYIWFSDKQLLNDRLIELTKPKPLTDEEKISVGWLPLPTDKKKLTEYEKKIKEEDDMIETQAKRAYNGLALYGAFFPNIDSMKVKFLGDIEVDVAAFYQNDNKVACLIPEMKKLPPGQYELQIYFSLNGQQWIDTEKKINFISNELGMSFEDIIKADENEKKKKPGKK